MELPVAASRDGAERRRPRLGDDPVAAAVLGARPSDVVDVDTRADVPADAVEHPVGRVGGQRRPAQHPEQREDRMPRRAGLNGLASVGRLRARMIAGDHLVLRLAGQVGPLRRRRIDRDGVRDGALAGRRRRGRVGRGVVQREQTDGDDGDGNSHREGQRDPAQAGHGPAAPTAAVRARRARHARLTHVRGEQVAQVPQDRQVVEPLTIVHRHSFPVRRPRRGAMRAGRGSRGPARPAG